MESLVVYYSETGNTEKVAKAIAEGLETEAKRINDEDANFVVICTPVHGGEPVDQTKDFVKKTKAKKAAVVWTCASDPGKTLEIMKEKLKKRNINFVGKLDIRVGRKAPTKDHLTKAKEFGQSLISKAS